MPTKYKQIGNRDHAFDLDSVGAMATLFEGGEDILYEGTCPMCDIEAIIITKNDTIQTPKQCNTCGVSYGFTLEEFMDQDKTRIFRLVFWYDEVLKGKSQAHRAWEYRGT